MDNLRLPLLVAFAAISFMLWSAWQDDYTRPLTPLPTQSNTASTFDDLTIEDDLPAPAAAFDSDEGLPPTPATSTAINTQTDNDTEAGNRITVETDLFTALINTKGGEIERLHLRTFRDGPEKNEKYRLLNRGPDLFFVAQSGLRASQRTTPAPNHHATFRSSQSNYKLRSSANELAVPLVWSEAGITVTKTLIFKRDSFEVEVRQQVENQGSETWSGSDYLQLQRNSVGGTGDTPFMQTYLGTAWYVAEEPDKYRYRKISFADLREAYEDNKQALATGRTATSPISIQASEGGWAAMVQHYFIAAAIPKADANNQFYARALKQDRYMVGYVGPQTTVEPGQAHEFSGRLYLGPKLQDILPSVAPDLARTVDYGWLTVLSDPLFMILNWFHNLLGNWGLAIMLLTLLIKSLFYKLSEAQYRSMARMRKFTPRIKSLRERYADDKEKLQRAMMELYKKEKFNPLGGCWPLLVQIPVFIALYWVLLESVELRDAPFFLWIDDLSQPDRFFLLPVLMGAGMIAQQKMSSSSMAMDPIQQKIMMAMPIAFTVFFAFFPSGLVLYWLVNTLLSITQQWYINRKIDREGAKS